MKTITLRVNGSSMSAEVEPRTHLGDFLRDTVRLTGTHLGCEHGVCGACTVLVDGQPVRSCITFAAACQDRCVTTVEGYDADEVMRRLRLAFNKHHALQCGFCTPGMLATARDIVLRLPHADEARIRLELSGNLCRCTGYVGIVAAIRDVLDQLALEPHDEVTAARAAIQAGHPIVPLPPKHVADGAAKPFPALAMSGARGGVVMAPAAAPAAPAKAAAVEAASAPSAALQDVAEEPSAALKKGTRIDASFELPFSADAVWAFMGDLPAVAGCLPGATIESQDGDKVKGKIAIKFGPMAAAFAGAARLDRDDARRQAVLRGAGQDSISKSRAQGDITYRIEAVSAQHSKVHVDMLYALQGPLAQFSRSGLVKDFVRRMVADFGQQVAHRMSGKADDLAAPGGSSAAINPVAILWSLLMQRWRRLFGRGD